MRRRLLFLSLLLLAAGDFPPDDLREIRHLAVLHNGRVKPLDSFAREFLDQVTGEPRFKREDPIATILSMKKEPQRWREAHIISIPFIPLREALGVSPRRIHISYNELIAGRALMRMLPAIVEKQSRQEKLSILENETMDLYGRFVAMDQLLKGELPHAARPDLIPARWRLALEVSYHRVNPFRIARWIYGVAALLLLFSLMKENAAASCAGRLFLVAGFLIHATGIVMRVIVSGRAPVSNFYETMLWLPFVAVGLSLIFEWVYRSRYFALASSILGAVVLALADRLPLDPSISPLVAVLRSNMWLTVHVLTIVASYGAITLGVVLAHVYGVSYLAKKTALLPSLETFLYRSIQVGVVLLSAGIMLGGVWANASWGRYWGWDPKETWALITLLWFLAVLHGRFAGWLKGVGFSLSAVGGFFLLLMTYYGVSFYLVGLHSYAGGHAKPLPLLLVAYLAAEAAFMAVIGYAAFHRRQPA